MSSDMVDMSSDMVDMSSDMVDMSSDTVDMSSDTDDDLLYGKNKIKYCAEVSVSNNQMQRVTHIYIYLLVLSDFEGSLYIYINRDSFRLGLACRVRPEAVR